MIYYISISVLYCTQKVVSFTVCHFGARAGLTIRGPHPNVRRGPFLIVVAMIFFGHALFFFRWECTFPQKVDDLFSRRYERQNSVVKNWQLIGVPRATGTWYNRYNG